jgi:N-methylhydantoinase A
MYRLGFDIGGTFTDFVLIDERSGATTLGKSLTTPHDPAIGVREGVDRLFGQAGIDGTNVDIVIHATTLITNALIERRGAKTALLATHGFRDVLELGTEVRYDIYDLRLEKPEPLVPRDLRFDVVERIASDGRELEPLDVTSLDDAVRRLIEAQVESVAVVFLHAFRNSTHELQALEFLRRALPNVTISLSSSVAPEIREFDRMSTTVANAYTQPLTRHYIGNLESYLAEVGYDRPLFLMISSGGIATAETAKDLPIRMVESGPAAGVLAAAYWGRTSGLDALISFDMGGTTAKIGLVKDHTPKKSNMIEVGRVRRFKKGSGLPIKVPVIELIEIGAGGGSIARADELGLLQVGPRSAGAEPGPACYGRGGVEPTVTDANVVLGYLDPSYFLGGAMQLDAAAARAALTTKLGSPLGLSCEEAAAGVFEVVNENMLSAMKVHVAERGEDPRRFHLFAFGGAGPAHGYELARSLRMRGVVVPPGAGTASAMGLVTAGVSFDFARSTVAQLDTVDWSDVRTVFEEMTHEGHGVLAQAGIDPFGPDVVVRHSMDLRHKGQGHEVTVAVPRAAFGAGDVAAMQAEFFSHYRQKYGHAHEELAVELITCRTVVAAKAPAVVTKEVATRTDPAPPLEKAVRQAYFPELGTFAATPVYDRAALVPGASIVGPAIVEERECTIVAGPSGEIHVDRFGNLFIDLRAVTTSVVQERERGRQQIAGRS